MTTDEMPSGWQVLPLSEVVDVLDHLRRPINSKERQTRRGVVPYFGATGQVGTIDDFLFDEELVLLGEDGVQFFDQSKPKAYEISDKAWVNNHAHVLRCRADKIEQKLLVHFLNQFDYRGFANGTTRLKLTQAAMNRIPVLLPPATEQREIVRILEEQFSRLDAAVASIAAVRRKADQFRRSSLHRAFGEQRQRYGSKTLGEVLSKLPSGRLLDQGWSPQCLREPVSNPHEWGVLVTTSVQHGVFDWRANKLLPASLKPRPEFEVKQGDFLMTRLGPRPRCGVTCLVRETRQQLMVPDKMYRFRPNNVILNPEFLNLYMSSPKFLDDVETLKTGTSESGMNITQSRFLSLEVPSTPISEQEDFVHLVEGLFDEVDAVRGRCERENTRIDSLRRSLLHAAFNGELTKEWREKNNG